MAAPELGRPAPDIQVLAEDDRPLRLSELWAGGPVVLFFLRHFG